MLEKNICLVRIILKPESCTMNYTEVRRTYLTFLKSDNVFLLDAETVLAEERVKTPCRRFIQHGECQFAGSCKYTHYSQEELWNLKQQSKWFIVFVFWVQYSDFYLVFLHRSKQKENNKKEETVASVEAWLEKYNQKKKKPEFGQKVEQLNIFWSYPQHLELRSDLPPSVKKFKHEDFKDVHFEDWGV